MYLFEMMIEILYYPAVCEKSIFRLCRFCLFIVDRNYDPFVCLFVCLKFYVPLENFSFIRRRHHYGEGLQILTYARNSWPLSSEGSLTCHTYRDTGHPFLMVISEDPWQSHRLPRVLQWSCHYLFLRLISVAVGIQNSTFGMRGERFNWLRHRSGIAICTSCPNIETLEFLLAIFLSAECCFFFVLWFIFDGLNSPELISSYQNLSGVCLFFNVVVVASSQEPLGHFQPTFIE